VARLTIIRRMAIEEGSPGRAPHPRRGDPNAKMIRLTLSPDEWRELRLRAAVDDTSVAAVIRQIVRRELECKPERGV
jgi:hypothetical protein